MLNFICRFCNSNLASRSSTNLTTIFVCVNKLCNNSNYVGNHLLMDNNNDTIYLWELCFDYNYINYTISSNNVYNVTSFKKYFNNFKSKNLFEISKFIDYPKNLSKEELENLFYKYEKLKVFA